MSLTTLTVCSNWQLDAYKPVVKYVHDLLHNDTRTRKYRGHHPDCKKEMGEDDDCWTMSVTGHSLGGGIATVVGSTLGIPVIDCGWFMCCVVVLRDLMCIWAN